MARRKKQQQSVHARRIQPSQEPPIASIPTRNGEILITRRHVLFGAAGVAGVAALAGGASIVAPILAEQNETITTISVPESSVSVLDDCTEVPVDTMFALENSFEMPYGTLIWCNNDTVAACLLPTETPSPLTQVALLPLGSGNYDTVLEEAQGSAEGFEIYDVRCSTSGLIWTEANILENTWRIFVAPLNSELSMGSVQKVDEGTGDWETPSIAAVGKHAFWQIMPKASSDAAKTTESSVKTCAFSSIGDVKTIYTSTGRMACPIGQSAEGVTIAPRVPEASSYYNLVYLDGQSGQTADIITLPSGMKPLAVTWGSTGFSFCFESIYSYGEGISNLGTYTPRSKPRQGEYSQAKWFRFGRTPIGAPCWSGNLFVVKSTQSVCAVNLSDLTYCAFGVESGCDDYGDTLATLGESGTVVTASYINQTETTGASTTTTLVRIWSRVR